MPGPVPEGVRFLGRLPPERLPDLYRSHDALVVPSRFEGFGKVFVEALSYGLPCIARRAFAMPELIQPRVNGDLVETDSPEELAMRIARVLETDVIYRNCEAASATARQRFNWDRAAEDIVRAARSTLALTA
jgi:glycosyltransferase involved in cell wall biosynthesis